MKFAFQRLQSFGIFFVLVLCPVCMASERLTIQDAVRYSLTENPEVKAVLSELEASKARKVQAKSAFFPKIDIEEDFSRTNSPVGVFMEKLNQERFTEEDFAIDRLNNPSSHTDWATRLIITQPIFNNGREIVGNKLAKKEEEIAEEKKEAILQRVAYKARAAYLEAILKKRRREVLELAVKTARQDLELSRKRYLAGRALKSDCLSAEARLMALRQELARAKSDARIAMAALNQVMARPQDIDWDLDQGLLTAEPRVGTLEDWLAKARRNRPELHIAEKMVEMAYIRKKGARLSFLPSLNLNGVYELHSKDPMDSDGESWALMARASFNIFNGLRDRGRLLEAGHQVSKARAERQNALGQVEFEVRNAYYGLKASNEAIKAAQSEVRKADEALRIVKSRYSQGLALMVEVLRAEDAVKEARLRLTQALFQARLSYLRLCLHAGVLNKELED